MPITQSKAHLQPIFKGRYYFGCKSALHFPSISSFIFLPSHKTKFSPTRKSPTDIRQRLNYLLCLTSQLSIPMTRQIDRPVYNRLLLSVAVQWLVRQESNNLNGSALWKIQQVKSPPKSSSRNVGGNCKKTQRHRLLRFNLRKI